MKKRSAYKPRNINPKAHLVALMGVQFMSPMDQMSRVIGLNAAIHNVIRAHQLQEAWCVVVDAVNTIEQLLKMPSVAKGGEDYIRHINGAVSAILHRYQIKNTPALYPGEVNTLHELGELWQELLTVVTHAEFFKAEEAVVRHVMTCRNAIDVTVLPVVEVFA